MAVFLASDVAWETRVIPFITDALEARRDRRAGDQPLAVPARTRRWLQPQTVAEVLDQQLTSGNGGAAASRPGPACTARGWTRRNYGDVTLQPGVSNQLTYEPGTGFVVNFTNQGENDEFDVKVTLRITREGGDPITDLDDDPAGRDRRERHGRAPARRAAAARHRRDDPRNVARCRARRRSTTTSSSYPALFIARLGRS